MSIPYWRDINYTDDGCSLYECLNCYRSWEGRTDPKQAEWKFCPYCGCQWEDEKEWSQAAKWERKEGENPKSHDRLTMPLFVVQKKSIPYDEKDTISDEWKNVSNQSESLIEALSTLSYVSGQEASCDPFYCYEVYRIIYNPYLARSFQKPPKTLKWTTPYNGSISEIIKSLWKKYQHNKKEIEEKVANFKSAS